MQPGLFQKTIQRRNPSRMVMDKRLSADPAFAPALIAPLEVCVAVWRPPLEAEAPGSILQGPPRAQAGLGSQALATGSLDWFSSSPSEATRSRLSPPWPSA